MRLLKCNVDEPPDNGGGIESAILGRPAAMAGG
jgi:hypothetical protein